MVAPEMTCSAAD